EGGAVPRRTQGALDGTAPGGYMRADDGSWCHPHYRPGPLEAGPGPMAAATTPADRTDCPISEVRDERCSHDRRLQTDAEPAKDRFPHARRPAAARAGMARPLGAAADLRPPARQGGPPG